MLIRTAERAFSGGLLRPLILESLLLQPILPALVKAGERTLIGSDPSAWRKFRRIFGETSGHKEVLVRNVEGDAAGTELTQREIELIAFLDAGLSNQEIADRLSIKLSTVKWHLNNLFSKLSVKNRTSAVRYAKGNNLL